MIKITTYGLKHGVNPPACDFSYDCRILPNPYRDPKLRKQTGKSRAVQDYVFQTDEAQEIVADALAKAAAGVEFQFFCYGGHHRSVSVAEVSARFLRDLGHEVEVTHLSLAA